MIEYDQHFGYQHRYAERYAGLPVVQLTSSPGEPPPDSGTVAWRISGSSWPDGTYNDKGLGDAFDAFFERADPSRVTAIIIGEWPDCFTQTSAPIVERLVREAPRLPALRSLFLGAISGDYSEISWIQQTDVTPILEAYPQLERFEVRGGSGLRLDPVRHEALRTLRVETGGLDGSVTRAVAGSDLPALQHLELWLGVDEYGGTTTIADLDPILRGERLPALSHLGLQDSELQDDIAAAVASAPVVARLETLALSMGVLTDQGAEALLTGQPLTHLRRLDLHHHYLSDEMMRRVTEALPGVEVDLSGQEEPDEDDGEAWHYVAVSE
ncbi:leucine-rich repeat domain-containing protein [Nonomuraea turkmeniaca]|uniref:Leucine-rich repeat domain-containing protein n=1 Tax=Nonomuraea turkmeniaca TaxID=103838 RepID=A0A5S4F950_9ACTN|nr:STM4015 family protein [Nonomuraea turkmeniaca]TMR13055.1 leucine-rich repeat domain-containing protein [Nonomuraea turkmeniaca]